jgi:cyanophycinase-like exopeptidase
MTVLFHWCKFIFLVSIFYCCAQNTILSQDFTSYFTGNLNDKDTLASGGVCMMGGATEHDEAMKWFLKRANGGDVLVLRASGSNGYNDYFYSELGIQVNSVETIVFHNQMSSFDTVVINKIKHAEAIWFAGGDQWNYISYWRNTPIDSIININILEKNIVIGGTSAGMAILPQYYFSAENGTISSSEALANPYNPKNTVDTVQFLKIPFLENLITDTHYDNPDRKGRNVVFLAKLFTIFNKKSFGISCNEYTAVCIDNNGIASVYGDYPNYEEAAYFLQINCENSVNLPEVYEENTALSWINNQKAVKVCKLYGTNDGANTFDLNDWKSSNNGIWQDWYVENNTLHQTNSSEIICENLEVFNLESTIIKNSQFQLEIESKHKIKSWKIISITGKTILESKEDFLNLQHIEINHLSQGTYFLVLDFGTSSESHFFQKL